jgi:acetolactate synthase-1/2/3 large subunit
VATSGPGATNLVTGIADAAMDSVPLVAITGQVATGLMGTDAFQEVDIYGLTLPIVKHSFLARRACDLPQIMGEAFRIAAEGRPGPVLIDLPKDVQTEPAPASGCQVRVTDRAEPICELSVQQAIRWLETARQPLFYAGGGIGIADAVDEFRSLLESTKIPCVATLKGLGAVATSHPLFLGMLGMHGGRAANQAVQESDLLLCVGARFDDRATGKLDEFAPRARVIHLDIDAAEIGKLRHADVALKGELTDSMAALRSARIGNIDFWRHHCLEQKSRHAHRYDHPGPEIYAPRLLRDLSEMAGEDATICCDVGQHQMWVAQHCRINHPRNHLSSGSLGAMGFGLPAGIGARLARPDSPVVVVTGDGSVMMNIQELATLKRYQIDLKIVLLDNASLGMVRQWQELFFEENLSEVELPDNPDFAALARAFGIDAFTLSRPEDVQSSIRQLLAHDGPCLMHVPINPRSNVWPLVPPGRSNAFMMEKSS